MRPVQMLEVRKAKTTLATGKASGPDGFPRELYKRASALARVLTHVFNAVMITGRLPTSLMRISLAPLLQPGQDLRPCESRRPISLIGAAVQILKNVLYWRMLLGVEREFDPRQAAYRRSSGAEMVLAEVYISGVVHSAAAGLRRSAAAYLAQKWTIRIARSTAAGMHIWYRSMWRGHLSVRRTTDRWRP